MNKMNEKGLKTGATILCSVIVVVLSLQIMEPVFGLPVYFVRGLLAGLAFSAIVSVLADFHRNKKSQPC